MNTPPDPLREALDDGLDEETVARMWLGVQARRSKRAGVARTTMALAGGVALAAAAAGVFVWGPMRSGARGTQTAAPEAGPLLVAQGGVVGTLEATGAAPLDVRFSDGSQVSLSPGALVEPLENTGRTFSAMVRRGRVHFEVRPRGPRRWSVECGVATVEVVGTGFTVERDDEHLRVSVSHGAVLVRGERIEERVRRLTAGESLDVPLRVAARVSSEPAAPSATATAAPSATGVAAHEPVAAHDGAWRALATRGAYREAYGALGSAGIAGLVASSDADRLMALADVARLSGHPADAVAPLRRVLTRYASSAQATTAAYTLGRIELDHLRQFARAAADFERAARTQHPLREEALALVVQARARAGDIAGARAAAEDYLAQFPGGMRAGSVRRWSGTEGSGP